MSGLNSMLYGNSSSPSNSNSSSRKRTGSGKRSNDSPRATSAAGVSPVQNNSRNDSSFVFTFSGDHGFGDATAQRMYGVCVVFPTLHHYVSTAAASASSAATVSSKGEGWTDQQQQRAPSHSGGELMLLCSHYSSRHCYHSVNYYIQQHYWLCTHAYTAI
jgi:hypothetical protein